MIVCPIQQNVTGFGVRSLHVLRRMDEEKRVGVSWCDDAQLPSGAVPIYQPSRFDVLLGRGRGHVSNPGNRRLQVAVNMHKDRYNCPSTTRAEKTKITTDIVHFIKACGTEQGRFLKYHGIMGCWFEVEDEVARLKVSQALRYTRRAISSSCSFSGDQDSVSVASQLSHNDVDFVVRQVTSSSNEHTTTKGETSCNSRTTDHSTTLLPGYDAGSALDPIGPDFEW